jgi:hypothetical protein
VERMPGVHLRADDHGVARVGRPGPAGEGGADGLDGVEAVVSDG